MNIVLSIVIAAILAIDLSVMRWAWRRFVAVNREIKALEEAVLPEMTEPNREICYYTETEYPV